MIEVLKDLPANVVGFRASGEVTKQDFQSVVMPWVKELVQRTKELNYMMVLDTPASQFTPGAW